MKNLSHMGFITLFCLSITVSAQQTGNPQKLIDEDIINDPHFREEKGLNFITAPSIDKIFNQLDKLAPLPLNEVPSRLPKRMPLERADLAIELGFLISEGFLTVQSGNMKKIEPLAAKLSKYSNALGAGDKIKGHAASILAHAKNNDITKLKQVLATTQKDVEQELIVLQDVDLSHLISLGGWVRALEISSYAVNQKYTAERAKLIYREDIADYYEFILESLKPELKKRDNIKNLAAAISKIKLAMTLKNSEKPSAEGVKKIATIAQEIVKQSLTREN